MSGVLRTEVLVVGGGPSGLSAAAALAPACRVLVLDREAEAGGITRHSDHTGYGVRDLRTVTTGPKYARRLVDAARDSGAEIRTEAMVTGWAGERTVEVTTPEGRITVEADAVVLATGARERPRTARLVAGDRPAGVLSTGLLQNLVHLQHRSPGTRAVVVGSELVSWSAVLTLREAGCRTVLMTTERPYGESYAALRVPASTGLRVPVATRTRVVRVVGRDRVEGVDVLDLATGARRHVRHRCLHRRLDPRERSGRTRGSGHRCRHTGAVGRHGPAHLGTGDLRGGQPAPSGDHRRRLRSGRPAHSERGRSLARRHALADPWCPGAGRATPAVVLTRSRDTGRRRAPADADRPINESAPLRRLAGRARDLVRAPALHPAQSSVHAPTPGDRPGSGRRTPGHRRRRLNRRRCDGMTS